MLIKQRQKVRCFLIIFMLLAIACKQKNNHIQRIYDSDTYKEGVFLNDSIPNGKIKIYETTTKELVATREFKNGMPDGESVYYIKGHITQISHYKNGLEEGYTLIFDPTRGNLMQRQYYLHGRYFGPVYTYNATGSVSEYEFNNFENDQVFFSALDSSRAMYKHSNFEKLSHFTVNNVTIDNKQMLKLFAYTIQPPKTKVIHKVVYIDKDDHPLDSTLLISNNEAFWEGFIDRPQPNRTPVFVVSIYDSSSAQSKTIMDYILEKE